MFSLLQPWLPLLLSPVLSPSAVSLPPVLLFTILLIPPAAIPQFVLHYLQSMEEIEEVAAETRLDFVHSVCRPTRPRLRRALSDPGFPYPDIDLAYPPLVNGDEATRGGESRRRRASRRWRKLRLFIRAARRLFIQAAGLFVQALAELVSPTTTLHQRAPPVVAQVAPRSRATDVVVIFTGEIAVALTGGFVQWSFQVEKEGFMDHLRPLATAAVAAFLWQVMWARTRRSFIAYHFSTQLKSAYFSTQFKAATTQQSAASNLWRKARYHVVTNFLTCSWIWALVYTLQVPPPRTMFQLQVTVALLVRLGMYMWDFLLRYVAMIGNRVRRPAHRRP